LELKDQFLRYQGLEDRSTKVQERCAELTQDQGLRSEFLQLAAENQERLRALEKIARLSRYGMGFLPALIRN